MIGYIEKEKYKIYCQYILYFSKFWGIELFRLKILLGTSKNIIELLRLKPSIVLMLLTIKIIKDQNVILFNIVWTMVLKSSLNMIEIEFLRPLRSNLPIVGMIEVVFLIGVIPVVFLIGGFS